MPIGDYVPCPFCNHSMIYGSLGCSDCMEKMGMPRQEFGLGQSFKYPLEIRKKYLPKLKEITLVVNLFAGPGVGKSTTAAGIFYDLKNLGVNCEIASEYAKDLTWEKRDHTFLNQVYVFGKQHHRIFRLLDQVDVVITDSPILLTPVYDEEKRATFEKFVVEEHSRMWTYNVFLKRKKEYNPVGRNHTEEEAREIDLKVLDVLNRNHQSYEVFDPTPEGKIEIVSKILLLLENR